jgi:hypothetical protein
MQRWGQKDLISVDPGFQEVSDLPVDPLRGLIYVLLAEVVVVAVVVPMVVLGVLEVRVVDRTSFGKDVWCPLLLSRLRLLRWERLTDL